MAIKHALVSGGIVNQDDYEAAHVLDGTAGMLLGADGAEIDPDDLGGADGLSAYQIAVAGGFVGTQEAWLASLQGADSTVPGPAGNGSSTQLREALGRAPNLFNGNATYNRFLVSGVITTGGGGDYWVTDYMPMEAGQFVANKASTMVGYFGASRGTAFYDQNKTYISSLATDPAAGTPATVPANTAYCVMGFYTIDTKPTGLMVVQGATLPSSFVPYGVPRIDDVVSAVRTMQKTETDPRENLYRPAQSKQFFSLDEFNVETASGIFAITNYFTVTPGGTFTTFPGAFGGDGLPVMYYDQAKNFIGKGPDLGPFAANKVHAVPLGASYARFRTFDDANMPGPLIIKEGSVTITAENPTRYSPAKVGDISPWQGKSFAVLGDSISDSFTGYGGGDWFGIIAKDLSATVGLNAAKAGRAMVDALKKYDDSALAGSDFTNVDLTMLWMGTNDWGLDVPLGTLADSTATASFYGRTKKAIEQLIAWKPSMKIVVGTLLQRTGHFTTTNAVGLLPTAYSTALREVANYYSLPILDWERTSGFNLTNIGTLSGDGLHPNATGYAVAIRPTIKGFLSTLRPSEA